MNTFNDYELLMEKVFKSSKHEFDKAVKLGKMKDEERKN